MKTPMVDIGRCSLCLGCVEICPTVFRLNQAVGYIEVIHLDRYPEPEVDEAIKLCPEDCLGWEAEP